MKLGDADPQHLPRIGKPQWAGLAGEPGARNPGDLERHVGAQRQHVLRNGVHDAEGVGGDRRALVREEARLELRKRRVHPLIAVQREQLQQPRFGSRLERGVRRQDIAQSRRQQGPVGHRERRPGPGPGAIRKDFALEGIEAAPAQIPDPGIDVGHFFAVLPHAEGRGLRFTLVEIGIDRQLVFGPRCLGVAPALAVR